MRLRLVTAGIIAGSALAVFTATAAADTVVLDGNVAQVIGADPAPGEGPAGDDAWRANGVSRIELYLTPEILFGTGTTVRVSELARIRWMTNKPDPQTAPDWYVNVYTAPDGFDDDSGWYGRRISFEGIYGYNLNAPADQWNEWTTDAGQNQLSFFDSNRTAAGFYNGPTLSDLTSGPVDWGNYPASGSSEIVDYSNEEIFYIVLATGNPWSAGFLGLVDGLEVELTDNSVATVDIEASFPEAYVGPDHFGTIQEAIDAVDVGGTVHIPANAYTENLSIGKSLTLSGANAGISPITEARGAETVLADSRILLVDGVSGITINGLTLTGSAAPATIDATNSAADNVTIVNNVFTDITGGSGAVYTNNAAKSHDGWVIDNNMFTNIGYAGDFANLPAATASALNTWNASHVTITNNLIDGVAYNGINLETVSVATVSGNTIRNIGKSGIQVANTTVGPIDITNNLFDRCNRRYVLDANYWYGAVKFYSGGTETMITGDVTVSDNRMADSVVGILAARPINVGAALDITGNDIVGNALAGFLQYRTEGAPIDLGDNWWGDAAGPQLGTWDAGTESVILSPTPVSTGDVIAINAGTSITYESYQTAPTFDNILQLNVVGDPVYLPLTEDLTLTVNLDAMNLAQFVTGAQAMLHFNSDFFKAASPADVAVAAGGGVWDELLWNMVQTSGDLDVAVGVQLTAPVGTKEDGTVATITLKLTGAREGTTRLVFRADVPGDDTRQTFFSDLANQAVFPTTTDSQDIIIDGTPPADFDPVLDTACSTGDVEVSFATTDGLAGIDRYELIVDGVNEGAATSPAMLALAEGDHTVQVRAYDKAGNVTDSSIAGVSVDQSGPAISGVTAEQAGASVLCPSIAIQGTVDIYVTANDDGCAALQQPTVDVAGIGPATFVDVSGDTWQYQLQVLATTPNGSHAISVTAQDALGNTSINTDSEICVNKNQVTGTVSIDTLSPDDYSFDRSVTFVVSDGGTTQTLVRVLSFTNDADSGQAFADYVLTDVIDDVVSVTADTDWTLIQKVDGIVMTDGQATADFTGSELLRGGDLDGSNTVNILDYSTMKTNWFTTDPEADINGDGQVQILDYNILKVYWFTAGDAP